MNLQTEIRIIKTLAAGIIGTTVFMASTAHAGQIADLFRHYNRKLSQQQALNFERIVNHTGKSFGISPNLIASIIVVESGARPNVVSRGGDYGLMQVRYKVHKDKVRSSSELLKPEINIRVGTRIFAQYFHQNYSILSSLLRNYKLVILQQS